MEKKMSLGEMIEKNVVPVVGVMAFIITVVLSLAGIALGVSVMINGQIIGGLMIDLSAICLLFSSPIMLLVGRDE